MSFAVALTCCHSFWPVYLKGCPYNLLDKKPDLPFAALLICYLGLQLLVLHLQQRLHPRFFIPKRLRMDPLAYNYF